MSVASSAVASVAAAAVAVPLRRAAAAERLPRWAWQDARSCNGAGGARIAAEAASYGVSGRHGEGVAGGGCSLRVQVGVVRVASGGDRPPSPPVWHRYHHRPPQH